MTTWILRIDNGLPTLVYGRRDAIMDAAYDNGAMRVTIIPEVR
jgi:hypothetical protein